MCCPIGKSRPSQVFWGAAYRLQFQVQIQDFCPILMELMIITGNCYKNSRCSEIWDGYVPDLDLVSLITDLTSSAHLPRWTQSQSVFGTAGGAFHLPWTNSAQTVALFSTFRASSGALPSFLSGIWSDVVIFQHDFPEIVCKFLWY